MKYNRQTANIPKKQTGTIIRNVINSALNIAGINQRPPNKTLKNQKIPPNMAIKGIKKIPKNDIGFNGNKENDEHANMIKPMVQSTPPIIETAKSHTINLRLAMILFFINIYLLYSYKFKKFSKHNHSPFIKAFPKYCELM
jgi:hypothetical protein